MVGGNSKAAKIMKINGEFFKFKVPSKVIDVTKDYPHHILLDSQDFLKFNLRAIPLSPYDDLQPRKIYLLVQLPKFPHKPNDISIQSPLRRAQSGVLESTPTARESTMVMKKKLPRRSISDLTMNTKSTADSPVGPTRVKMRLPKAQVQKIMDSGDDDVEIAQRILRLYFQQQNGDVSGSVADVEEGESGVEADVERHFEDHVNGYGMCSPCYSYRRKYKKLTF